MKLATLGKIQIWVGMTIFLALVIANAFVYFAMMNVVGVEINRATAIGPIAIVRDPQLIVGFFILFTEILIVGDIIALILITMLIIDGAAMLSKD